ncbi:MAG TPA: DUF885 domain-containing protein [Thermoplasmata archaeon]|nr:DUF885 domain-containing protein [Thermoplasmata archaeon]
MPETSESESAASIEFRKFLARDWEAWLDDAPELATAVGAPGRNDRWNDDSPAGIAARRHHLAEVGAQLDRFDPARLSPGERLNHDLYRELFDTTEAGLDFGIDPFPFRMGSPHNLWMPVNLMEGVHLAAADVGEIAPRASVRDYEDLLARFAAFPTAVDRNLALLVAGQARGYTAPRPTLAGIPDQITAQIPDDPKASPILKPFEEFPDSIPVADRARLLARAIELYRTAIVPALTKIREYLAGTYIPAARESVGASALPRGAEFYAYLVRWTTTTDLTPQQVHDIGLAEVRRLRGEMDRLIESTGFQGSFAEFHHFLRTDPQFFYHAPEELLDGYRVIAKRIDPNLSRLFGRLPRLPYGVQEMPEYRARNAPGAYYQPGAPATGRAGYFFANTHKVEVRPKWEMEALTLHEAVPGHHLQIALAQEPEGLPEFRRQTGYTAFVEGWGLYAESLGEELGLYRDPYSKFGQLTYDAWRSIRLVVDTGMHALGWSRDQAIQFFRENSGKSDTEIRVEVDRYIGWPGQALAYKIGQLKFRELRTRAVQRLKDRFDVRAFHDLLLGEGALPLGLVSERVDRWIESRLDGRRS